MKNKHSLGIILIIIGLYLLLKNIGLINWSLFQVMADLWPVFLIAFGLQIISGHKKQARIAIFLMIAGIFFGYGIYLDLFKYSNSEIVESVEYNNEINSTVSQISTLQNYIKELDYTLEFESGELKLGSSIDELLYKIDVPSTLVLDSFEINNSNTKIKMYDNSYSDNNFFTINLSKKVNLNLNLGLSNNSNHSIILSDLSIKNTKLETDNSSINMEISSKNNEAIITIDGSNNMLNLYMKDDINLNLRGNTDQITWINPEISNDFLNTNSNYSITLIINDPIKININTIH